MKELNKDLQEIKDSAVRVVSITSRLLQVDPEDKSAKEGLELAQRQLSRHKRDD